MRASTSTSLSLVSQGTFDAVRERCRNKPLIVFGVTGAAVCELMGIARACARGH